MAVTVSMPQLGETVTEGTILSWAKQVGDTIAEDEVLLEISTDKVDTEVPSPAAGVIQEILVAAGETVTVGTPLVVIGEEGEASPSASEPATEDIAAEPAAEEPAPEGEPAAAAEAPPSETAPSVGDGEQATSADPGVTIDMAVAPADDAPADDALADDALADDAPADDAPAPLPPGVSPAARPAVGVMDGPRRAVLSPVVRRLATEHGIDLTHVPGTGEGGRITRKDVMDYVADGGPKVTFEPAPQVAEPEAVAEPTPVEAVTAPPAAAVAPTDAASPAPAEPQAESAPAATPAAPAPPAHAEPPAQPVQPEPAAPAAPPAAATPPTRAVAEGDEVVQLTRLRKRIAENMTNAKRTAAHVWASVEVDYERVERVRQAHREEFKAREGFSLTYLPFVARAVIDALEEYPVVNSSFRLDEGTQTFHSRVNLGIAVDMNQKGLVVISVKDADGLRMTGIARSIREKALRAREGNLEPDDISGATFSITNPGPYGSFMTAPIINVPNVAILSTDTVTKRAVVVTDEFGHDSIAIRHIGYLGLTWDHRAFDGSTAVLFLARIKENIQNWDWEQELS